MWQFVYTLYHLGNEATVLWLHPIYAKEVHMKLAQGGIERVLGSSIYTASRNVHF